VKWYQLAADQGLTDAQLRMGLMYQLGEGVKQDYEISGKFYRNAAEQGDSDAQLMLGLAYWSGRGVQKDQIHAYMWVNMAATNGSHEAIKQRDEYGNKMNAKQIEQAQAVTKKCKANNYKGCD
ncbi:MAG: tetratricopeptide repeat protein, partial [Methylococcaceae bacterium]